ncbi:MAG: LCP family protein [Dethiobacter sp.]|jgi:hypothetical protein|nr:LCP family protein [Dethiobacter sp.]
MGRGQLYQIKTRRKRVKTGRLLFLLVLCGFLATVLFSIRFIGVLNSLQDNSSWAASLPRPVEGKKENLLLFVVSDKDSGAHTAEVVLVAFHPQKKDFRAIYLPVETLVEDESPGPRSLGEVYSAGGRELLVDTVSRLMDIPIHYFMEIDEDMLPKTVDQLGGLKEKAILNGGDVLSTIYAEGLTSPERLENRRIVLTAMADRVAGGNWWQKIKTLHSASSLLATNLTWRKLLLTIESLKEVKYKGPDNIRKIDGSEIIMTEGSFWQVDIDRIPLLAAWLSGADLHIRPSEVTVEVLNGSGVKGIASHAASILEKAGFTVVRYGNADHYNYLISQVISRVPGMDAAKEIATLIPSADMRKEEIADSDVMVTVIIGKNYPQN